MDLSAPSSAPATVSIVSLKVGIAYFFSTFRLAAGGVLRMLGF
jgi:hypothetical protein